MPNYRFERNLVVAEKSPFDSVKISVSGTSAHISYTQARELAVILRRIVDQAEGITGSPVGRLDKLEADVARLDELYRSHVHPEPAPESDPIADGIAAFRRVVGHVVTGAPK
jgi:hypothetical protein